MKPNMKTYTLDEETIARIEALTKHYEMTASALIRKIVREAYQSLNNDPKAESPAET